MGKRRRSGSGGAIEASSTVAGFAILVPAALSIASGGVWSGCGASGPGASPDAAVDGVDDAAPDAADAAPDAADAAPDAADAGDAGDTRTLATLSELRGLRFGAMYQYAFRGGLYDEVFETEMNAMTVTAYWSWVTHSRSRDVFTFGETDEKVDWGVARGMELHGHGLVWYNDIPDWVEATPTSDVEAVMNEHIDTVVGRYAGRISVWDVVNEAVTDDDGTLRMDNKWAEAMGADYMAKAFRRAAAADPTAVLRYNDYGIEANETKFEAVKALLGRLIEDGVPVHALGWQMHTSPGSASRPSFSPDVLRQRMDEIADLGLDNYITELDVRIPEDGNALDLERQRQTYELVVETFLATRRHEAIVTWGLRDGDPYWFTRLHPLLFDEDLERKPAYYGVREALLGE